MGLRRLRYHTIDDLLADIPVVSEEPGTAALIRRLVHVRTVGWLTRSEFLAICRWKSPRSIRFCERNRSSRIRTVSSKVFRTPDERTRLELLTSLHGVSVPTASAILTLTDPLHYGVIDIRVWQLLYALRAVTTRPSGRGFTSEEWERFLNLLRRHAARRKVSVRRLELTLFLFHAEHQSGNLYAPAS